MDMRDKSLGGCALGCALALLAGVIILGAGYARWRLVS